MMGVKINFRLLLSVLVAVLIAAGCSAKPEGPIEVTIEANEFSFKSSLTEFQTGETYRLLVTNSGKLAHEIMIVAPTEIGMMEMGKLDEMALVMVPEDELPAGATKTFEYTFTASAPEGKLEFACHVTGHYEAGMKLPFIVR